MATKGGIEPGSLDRHITIEARAATDEVDGAGGPVEPWTTLATVWASKVDTEGRERYQAQQMASAVDTEWVIHYRADMDPELLDIPTLRRVMYAGRTHDIVHALHLGRREGIALLTLASTKVA